MHSISVRVLLLMDENSIIGGLAAQQLTHKAQRPPDTIDEVARRMGNLLMSPITAPLQGLSNLRDYTNRAMSGEDISVDPQAGGGILSGLMTFGGISGATPPTGAVLAANSIKPLTKGSFAQQANNFFTQGGKIQDWADFAKKWFQGKTDSMGTNYYPENNNHLMLHPEKFQELRHEEMINTMLKTLEDALKDNSGGSIYKEAGVPEPPIQYEPYIDRYTRMQEKAGSEMHPSDFSELLPRDTYPELPSLTGLASGTPTGLTPSEHVESLGFNPRLSLYKGYTNPDMNTMTGFRNPSLASPADKYERALFFADQPSIGNSYASHGKGTFLARPQNPMEIDWRAIAPNRGYNSAAMRAMIEAAHGKGADFLTVKGMEDIGSHDLQNQYLMLNKPEQMRKIQAQFDPRKINMNDLLATGAIGTAGAITIPQLIQGLGQPNQ
jgi:hypothetical protein